METYKQADLADSTVIKVVSWNVNAARKRAKRQADWLASTDADVFLLQEATIHHLEALSELMDLRAKKVAGPPKNPRQRPVAVMSRLPTTGTWLGLSEVAMPHIAIGATVLVGNQPLNVWSYHAPNGSNYNMEKVRHAHAMVDQLRATSRPTVLGGDFNTPRLDPVDETHIRTHWHTGKRGLNGMRGDDVLCGPPDARGHALQDALRVQLASRGPTSPELCPPEGPLAVSYRTRRRDGAHNQWRFDAIWVGRTLEVLDVSYETDSTLNSGLSDHAAVTVTLAVPPPLVG